MRLRYENFFDTCEYHGFQVFFLFSNILFSVFFIITQDVEFYLPTRRGNQLVYVDKDGTKYYLAETTKLLRRSLTEASEYISDYLEEVSESTNNFENLIKNAKNLISTKNLNDESVFDYLDNKLKLKDFAFKMMLENLAKQMLLENILQKDWFESAFKDAGYSNETCLFSSVPYIEHPSSLKKGLVLCMKLIARQLRKVAYEKQKADDRYIERESALGIANAIRSWQEENIDEVRLEVAKKKRIRRNKD